MRFASLALAAALAATTIAHFDKDGARVSYRRYHWDNVEIVGGGFVSGILFHPAQKNLVYARTDIGGAYRLDQKTNRWIPLVDWIQRPDWNLYGIESIGLDPTDPKRLYLAAGTYTNKWGGNGAILRSTDQGKTFQRADLPFKLGGNMDGRSMGERLAVDPNKNNILYFGSRNDGLWQSDDFGATWKKDAGFPTNGEPNGIGVCWEVFDKSSGKRGQATPTLYAGVSAQGPTLYRSTDGGSTWAPVAGQPTGLIPHHAAIDADGQMILTYGNRPGPNGISKGGVWELDTKTGTWTDITPEKPTTEHGFGYAGLSIDPHHKGTIAVTTIDRWNPIDDVYRTTDGGAHWTPMRPTAQMDSSGSPFLNWGDKGPKFGWWMGCVQIDPFNPARIMYGTGATIWGTNDATNVDKNLPTHWTVRAQGLEETAVIDLMSPPSGAHLVSALGDIGGFTHDDLKVTPKAGMQSNPIFGNTDGVDCAELNPNVMARVGRASAGVKRGAFSTDGGMSWRPFATEPKGSRGSGTIAVSSDGKAMLWTPSGSVPSITHDFGDTWTTCTGAPNNLHVVSDRVNPLKFYGYDGRSGTIFISIDGGITFSPAARDLPTGDSTLRAVPGSEGSLWIVAGKTLLHSKDGGASASKIDTATDASTVGLGKAAPGKSAPALYLIGAVNGVEGAFRSDDEGMNWVCITDPQHGFGTMDHIIGDPRIYGRVYIGTNGRGVLYGDPADH